MSFKLVFKGLIDKLRCQIYLFSEEEKKQFRGKYEYDQYNEATISSQLSAPIYYTDLGLCW